MQGAAAELMELHGTDAKTLHAKGIGFLLADDDKTKSIGPLQTAAERDPNNAKYQSDLAAALIAAARGNGPMLEQALAACDRALRIDPRSPDALFNRAVALQALGRPEAIAAYEHYLAVDPTSPWADEVRRHIEALRPLP
jgi:tetratricopeptide (TPR) repeat protein